MGYRVVLVTVMAQVELRNERVGALASSCPRKSFRLDEVTLWVSSMLSKLSVASALNTKQVALSPPAVLFAWM